MADRIVHRLGKPIALTQLGHLCYQGSLRLNVLVEIEDLLALDDQPTNDKEGQNPDGKAQQAERRVALRPGIRLHHAEIERKAAENRRERYLGWVAQHDAGTHD